MTGLVKTILNIKNTDQVLFGFYLGYIWVLFVFSLDHDKERFFWVLKTLSRPQLTDRSKDWFGFRLV